MDEKTRKYEVKDIERSLCDSCTNIECIFQSGNEIVRTKCAFYMPPYGRIASMNEWTPVSEKLPKVGQKVLVTYNQEDELKVDITYFDKYGFLVGKAIAWMPLPEPYKSESENI